MQFSLQYLQLSTANAIVNEEIERLENLSDAAFNSVNRLFEELGEIVEKKRLEMIADVRRRKNEKRKVLEQQLKEIEAQKSDININLSAIKHLDLQNVSLKIADLNSKLDCIRSKLNFQRNSFLWNEAKFSFQQTVRTQGKLLHRI